MTKFYMMYASALVLLVGGALYSGLNNEAHSRWAEFQRGRCSVLGDSFRIRDRTAECRFSTNLVFMESYKK